MGDFIPLVGFGVLLILIWGFILPIITFLHELAHAIAVLLLTSLKVTLLLEGWGEGIHFKRQRLSIIVSWFSGFFGFVKYDEAEVSDNHYLMITLIGPAASLLLTFLFWGLSLLWSQVLFSFLMKLFSVFSFFHFLFSIVPIRYPRWLGRYGGRRSDGLRALSLLRKPIKQ